MTQPDQSDTWQSLMSPQPEQCEFVDVINGRWTNLGKVKAMCDDCAWSRLLTQGGAVAAARRHVLETGHRVSLIRRQARSTIPRSSS